MDTKITVQEEGVVVIMSDGEIVGIIYNDTKTKAKRLFHTVEMSVEQIADLVKGTLYTGKMKSIVDETNSK